MHQGKYQQARTYTVQQYRAGSGIYLFTYNDIWCTCITLGSELLDTDTKRCKLYLILRNLSSSISRKNQSILSVIRIQVNPTTRRRALIK
jgi:hypothetical protein